MGKVARAEVNYIAAAWLAFKVAAKWAAWQHVSKIPERRMELADSYLNLPERLQFSKYLLGTFMNGTL